MSFPIATFSAAEKPFAVLASLPVPRATRRAKPTERIGLANQCDGDVALMASIKDRIPPRTTDEQVVTHESFPLHSSLLHNPPGSDIAHVGCRPNSLKREILEPK